MNQSYRFLKSFFLLFFLLLFLKNVYAIEYNNIGGKPAFPRPDNPRSESIFIHATTPGASIDEGVYVINNSSTKKTLLLYAADSTKSTDGGYACKQFAEPQTNVGTWITLEKSEVTLEPNSKELIPFTISVPASADVGEHNGCILIQEKEINRTMKPGVNLSLRTGMRVLLIMPGNIIRSLVVQEFQVEKLENGKIVIHTGVENKGNVSVDADIKVLVTGLWNNLIVKFGGGYSILRDDISRLNFELNKPFWGGWYSATFTGSYSDGQQKIELPKTHASFFSWPTLEATLIYIFVTLLIVISILWRFISRRRSKQLLKKWVNYHPMSGEDIQAIARKYEVSWKLLAKMNKLKAPYVISPHTTLKVPPQK